MTKEKLQAKRRQWSRILDQHEDCGAVREAQHVLLLATEALSLFGPELLPHTVPGCLFAVWTAPFPSFTSSSNMIIGPNVGTQDILNLVERKAFALSNYVSSLPKLPKDDFLSLMGYQIWKYHVYFIFNICICEVAKIWIFKPPLSLIIWHLNRL